MTKKYQVALAAKPMIKDQSLLRHEDIKQHIQVLPELAAYIPPLLSDEYKQLEDNIRQNGCREALLVWETTSELLSAHSATGPIYVLIDGHNRYEICQKYELDFKVHLMSFPSMEQVKFFMIDNQLGRRNLSPEQISYLRGLRYLREKKEKGKYQRDEQKGHNDLYESEAVDTDESGKEYETTAARLGKKFSVSEKTIKRDGTFAQGLDRLTPELRQDILASKVKVDKNLVQQLGKAKGKTELVHTVAELEQIGQEAVQKPKSDIKDAKSGVGLSASQLKEQLQNLVNQLVDKNANVTDLCKQIIEYARQLQQT